MKSTKFKIPGSDKTSIDKNAANINFNTDLESQIDLLNGENLVDAIDRNFKDVQRQDKENIKAAKKSEKKQDMDSAYQKEMLRQASYAKDNDKLAKDIKKLTKPRPSTAKSRESSKSGNNYAAKIIAEENLAKI